jgi:hypothetical protein
VLNQRGKCKPWDPHSHHAFIVMARLGPVPAEWGCSSSVYRTQGGSILVSFRRNSADLDMANF